jgi:hypothetical protein
MLPHDFKIQNKYRILELHGTFQENCHIKINPDQSYPGTLQVQHGGYEDLYQAKRKLLGQDPLRDDADSELLWRKVANKSSTLFTLFPTV